MKERKGYLYFDKSRKRWVGRVTYTDPTIGKRINKKCYALTKTEARTALHSIKQKLDQYGPLVTTNERTTFAQLATEFEKTKLIPAVFVKGKKVAGLKNPITPPDLPQSISRTLWQQAAGRHRARRHRSFQTLASSDPHAV